MTILNQKWQIPTFSLMFCVEYDVKLVITIFSTNRINHILPKNTQYNAENNERRNPNKERRYTNKSNRDEKH